MLSPKEVVKKWVDAFNAGDVDMIVSLYDNNATNHQMIYVQPFFLIASLLSDTN